MPKVRSETHSLRKRLMINMAAIADLLQLKCANPTHEEAHVLVQDECHAKENSG